MMTLCAIRAQETKTLQLGALGLDWQSPRIVLL